jgi:uncharacterized tellurite resistance protein B-like protein
MKSTQSDVFIDDPTTDVAVEHLDVTPPPSPELAMIVRSFASVLLGQAVADGEVQAVEMRQIERILRKTFYLGHSDTERFVREALNESVEIGSLAFENSLEALRERFLPQQRERFQEALLEVAEVDGYVDDRERFFAAYVSRRLGITKNIRVN